MVLAIAIAILVVAEVIATLVCSARAIVGADGKKRHLSVADAAERAVFQAATLGVSVAGVVWTSLFCYQLSLAGMYHTPDPAALQKSLADFLTFQLGDNRVLSVDSDLTEIGLGTFLGSLVFFIKAFGDYLEKIEAPHPRGGDTGAHE